MPSSFLPTDIFSTAILGVLLLCSVIIWTIILNRFVFLRNTQKSCLTFIQFFWKSNNISEIYEKRKSLPNSPASRMFHASYDEILKILGAVEKDKNLQKLPIGNIERILAQSLEQETFNLSDNLGTLATLATLTPFIGLLGTIIGIMKAFQSLGDGNILVLAPHISEALVATALGILTALPASFFYNFFIQRIEKNVLVLQDFSSQLLNLLERHFNISS